MMGKQMRSPAKKKGGVVRRKKHYEPQGSAKRIWTSFKKKKQPCRDGSNNSKQQKKKKNETLRETRIADKSDARLRVSSSVLFRENKNHIILATKPCHLRFQLVLRGHCNAFCISLKALSSVAHRCLSCYCKLWALVIAVQVSTGRGDG